MSGAVVVALGIRRKSTMTYAIVWRSAIVFALCTLASTLPFPETLLRHRAEQTKPDAYWDEVLKIAQSRGSDSRTRLAKMKEEIQSEPSKQLISTILMQWSDEAQTYFSEIPRVVQFVCLTEKQARVLKAAKVAPEIAVLEVTTDQRGMPVDVRVIKGAEDQRLRKAVVQNAKDAVFCPAKPADRFIEGVITLTCSHMFTW